MNKVFPLKYYRQVDRSLWGPGPWDQEEPYLDREQWSDPMTGYPCLAIRSDLGSWSGYVAVPYDHPAFGYDYDDLFPHGGITWCGFTNETHYIQPWPEKEGLHVDLGDPKSLLELELMPERLWFFGFDTAHHGDVIPQMLSFMEKSGMAYSLLRAGRGGKASTYKDINYIKTECAKLALALEEQRKAENEQCKEKMLSKRSFDS